MKIGFIIGSLSYSGAEKIAKYLLIALYRKYGHEVGVILLSGEGPYPEIGDISQFPIKTTGNRVTKVINRQKEIRRIVAQEQFDVVVSFGVKYNIDTIEALKWSRTKVILCERNDPVNDPHRGILRVRRKIGYPFADGYVFQTKRIAEFFGKRIAENGTIIPNFIENRKENIYNDLGENNIVMTARLDDIQKNISMLLRAFSVFSQKYDYTLYIVGDGPDREKFAQLVDDLSIVDKVIFTGKQNVYDYLKIAQFFVLPSNYEGMPNALIEAMSCGIPCIATDCSGGGAAYLIQNRVNGTLIPVNNENELVRAMTELADSSELRKQYSLEAHKINDLLQIDRILDQWVDYIEKFGKK